MAAFKNIVGCNILSCKGIILDAVTIDKLLNWEAIDPQHAYTATAILTLATIAQAPPGFSVMSFIPTGATKVNDDSVKEITLNCGY